MTTPVSRIDGPRLRVIPRSTPPLPAPVAERTDDVFPTVVPRLRPLSRHEEGLVQQFHALMDGLDAQGTTVHVVPLDHATSLALRHALDVASTDRDRLGDHMVHEYRLRTKLERDLGAACQAARDAHGALDQLLTFVTPLLEWAAPRLGVAPTLTAVLAAVPRQEGR